MNRKVLIIAEAGVNHNGSLELAKQLALKAKEAGADIVKFQTFVPDKLVARSAKMAEYQKENIGKEESQLDMLKKLTLELEEFKELKLYCDEIGIRFLSTPFDLGSIAFLDKLGVPFWKIPSGEVTNTPYLKAIAKTGRPVIMSTGMCNLDEITFAVETLKKNGTKELSLLHCNTQYPTPFEDVNLKAMDTLRKAFNCTVGYSDHTIGTEAPIAAVAMGAEIIEKHFTLDKTMEGPDHKASLNPEELTQMVLSIRNIEKALGSSNKVATVSESGNKAVARKSIVAATGIRKGEIFTEDNLTTKRPGTGISPIKWDEIIGKVAIRDFNPDELIEI